MANNPTLLAMPLAENGTKNVIPETQATAGDGLFSQSTGFPAETSLPLGAGGVAPSREDFNGMANLLGGVAFMAQKGFTFNYDATQDYYTGCVVIDNGNRYLCVADMTAGTVAPSSDTTGDYWILYPVGVINKRDVITTSGTYTAPVTGWYKITAKGGGGGGAGGSGQVSVRCGGGGGGGEGGMTIVYKQLTAGDTVSVVVGAGGNGGAAGATGVAGASGGDTSVSIGVDTYTANGGVGGSSDDFGGVGGAGGNGTIPGAPGGAGNGFFTSATARGAGGSGGGTGGGAHSQNTTATFGGGGAGGRGITTSGIGVAGGAGGDGFVWFEYYAAV